VHDALLLAGTASRQGRRRACGSDRIGSGVCSRVEQGVTAHEILDRSYACV